jgi:hypothetical protein
MSFEITGRLHKKYETEDKTATFQAREFVLEINTNNYMQYIKFQLTQDRCGLLDPYSEGQNLKVYFDLRGREWNGKYFTNLNAWKLENGEGSVSHPEDPFSAESFPTDDKEPVFDDKEEDDLPF